MGDASRLMVHSCDLIRVTQTIVDGDLEETISDPVTTPCAIFPSSTTEAGGRVVVEASKREAFFPADLDFEGVDRIVFDGDVWQLDGPPMFWPATRSMQAYQQANLARTA